MDVVILILLALISVSVGVNLWLWGRMSRSTAPTMPVMPTQPLPAPTDLSSPPLQALIDSSPDAIFLSDRNGKYLISNRAHYTSLGASSPQEVLGKTIEDFLPPEIAKYLLEEDAIVRRKKAPLRIEIPDPRPSHRRWIRVIKTPIFDEQGEVAMIAAVIQDITAVKQARDELEQRTSQMHLLSHIDQEIGSTLDLNSVTMFALDMLMRISVADAGFIALFKEDSEALEVVHILGTYQTLRVGATISPYVGVMGRAIADRQAVRVLDVANDPDYVSQSASTKALVTLPLMAQDQFVGVIRLETTRPERFTDEFFQFAQLVAARIALAIDNARLYQLVRQKLDDVSRLEQLKTDMIRIASHDLKNPLAIIEGYLMILGVSDYDLPAEVVEMFASMQRAADRMNRILLDILSLERINERAKGAYKVLDFAPIIHNAVKEYREQAAHKQQQLHYSPPTREHIVILGDEAQLYEAATNLISNAVKYTPEGGRIDVSLEAQDGHLTFQVVDTGFGIPEEMQARLFEPFYRARTDETRTIEGTGLGLHLVKNIIERHGGQMIFHSVYGQGSAFGFRLPLSTNHPQGDAHGNGSAC
ncbi:PAS domain-containing sensor histidine kinase [Aggregatilineales bacterium SYSU G02658]